MKLQDFKSLGKVKQYAYNNKLEEINRQKQALIEVYVEEIDRLEKENIILLLHINKLPEEQKER